MPKMRAMIVTGARAKLLLEERDIPEPGRHEVRIRVQACGVCHSDAATIEGAGDWYSQIHSNAFIDNTSVVPGPGAS